MQTEKELDRVVEEIRSYKSMSASATWLLARKLAEVDVSGLWKVRLRTDLTPAHKTFDDFVRWEVGFTRKHYQDLLRLVAAFSEEEFKRFGPKKLRLVLQATTNEEAVHRRTLLEGGASSRQIENSIRRLPPIAASHVREHERLGEVVLDLDREKRRLRRVRSLGDLLALEKIIRDVIGERARVRKRVA